MPEANEKNPEETKAELTPKRENPMPKKPKSAKKKKSLDGNFLTLILASIALTLSAISLVFCLIDFLNGDTPITINPSSSDGNSVNFVEGSIAEVASKVNDSVVSITTETRTTSWFGQSSTSSAAGTGIIVSKSGYILTNKHVIEGANKINIILSNGEKYSNVSVATVDPLNDVAFLKISDVDNLPAATLGDSKTLSIGQQVIAIGNALGQFANTVTSGIISGTGRSITATDSSYSSYETLSDLIQTDAAINAGNSGGPLVNAAGEVIGINTATSSDGEGIGFAIPISSIKGMLSQLLETGSASRSYLGVYSITITPSVVETYDLPVSAGAYLYYESGKYMNSAIQKNSPAEKAGLKNKDIITAVNGSKLGPSASLSSLIGEYKPNDTVQLSILREGKEIAINVTLGAYSED